jgi:hypothetical protein
MRRHDVTMHVVDTGEGPHSLTISTVDRRFVSRENREN